MLNKIAIFSLCIFMFALSGCNKKTKSFLGLSKTPPDEFTVIPNQPLTIPPMFTLPDSNAKEDFGSPERDEASNIKKTLSSEDKNFMRQFNNPPPPHSESGANTKS